MAETRTLLLLRHAKSSWADPAADDFDRPLNARGRGALRAIAGELARAPPPALVLCSAARRTRETLDGVAAALAGQPEIRIEPALYLADAATLERTVRDLPDAARCVLLVGHNPGLHELAEGLCGRGDSRLRRRLADKFPTGALAVIAFDGGWEQAVAGAGRLVEFVTPRDLA
ncbi:phosphohistidine phosphatase [Allostella vacuolata]|nr:phosphohistidine phosphatase [Stella vacuolata]